MVSIHWASRNLGIWVEDSGAAHGILEKWTLFPGRAVGSIGHVTVAAPARGAAPARREKSGISRPLECNSTVFSVIQTHVVVLVDVTVHTFTLKVVVLLYNSSTVLSFESLENEGSG